MRLKKKGGLAPLWASISFMGPWSAALGAIGAFAGVLSPVGFVPGAGVAHAQVRPQAVPGAPAASSPGAPAASSARAPAPSDLTLANDATQLALLPPPRRPGGAGGGSTTETPGASTTKPSELTLEASPPAPVEPPSPIAPVEYPQTRGFTGRRTVMAQNPASGSDFVPLPDRYRIGIAPGYVQNTRQGRLPYLNPYNQNVLKGDYPIIGSDKFLILTVTSDTLLEARRVEIPSGTSTAHPENLPFFGRGDMQLFQENLIVSTEFFKGDTLGYQPRDYQFVFTPVFNANYVHAEELGVISPDVRNGRDRTDSSIGIQEAFFEKRLADLSPNYDVAFVRVGIQPFNSDFRGFLYSDNELGIRVFGTYDNNKTQFNLAWFTQLEKQTNSGLNNLSLRGQDVYIANVYRQDFLFKGYTAQFSAQANFDNSNFKLDDNGFPARPAVVGTVREKNVRAYYLGWAGDGHIGRINITHQFYQALGTESFNQISNQSVNINARFFAIEASIDKDYERFRASFAYVSGDGNPRDHTASGFDTIFDNPNFAGGGTNYFTRQAIGLSQTGVGLVGHNSFVTDLRTSKEQGQANFVNPGLLLYNIGYDIDVTPKVKVITNLSWLQFENTESLKFLLQDQHVGRDIGLDYSIEVQYRPFLNQNAIINFGAAALTPARGFRDIYDGKTLYSFFTGVTLTY